MASETSSPSRRSFLEAAAGMSGGLMAAGTTTAAASPLLPTVKFFNKEVTRLIIGSNPFYGYSHFNRIYDGLMREWMTQDRRIEVLHACERAGINTWQLHYSPQTLEDLKRYRDEGGRMHWLLLGEGEMMKNYKLIAEAARLGPIGIAHHGNRTDERFREGKMQLVQDFYKTVQDAGLPGGISTHNPAVVAWVEDKGWDNDYYMTCFYRVTRTPEDARAALGEAPLGEIYMENDPQRMSEMVRQTKKPCFAFKILAAGRFANQPQSIEAAFRFALTNIKPQDAVIVGMFPRFRDEVRENAELVRRICGAASS